LLLAFLIVGFMGLVAGAWGILIMQDVRRGEVRIQPRVSPNDPD